MFDKLNFGLINKFKKIYENTGKLDKLSRDLLFSEKKKLEIPARKVGKVGKS